MTTTLLPAALDSLVQPAPALTTEAELADPARAATIDDFWRDAGRFGRFRGQGGLSLAYAAFVQPDRASERGAVVVSNGRTESLIKYPEVAFDLWRNGHSVYLYDHRGQGLSDREPAVASAECRRRGHVGYFDDYVEDLRAFVRTEVAAGGHHAHYLLAHSMGGTVAALLLEAPGDAQTLFRAAALSSPMLSICGPGRRAVGALPCRIAAAASALGMATWSIGQSTHYEAPPFEANVLTRSAIRYARWQEAYAREPAAQLGAPTIGWLAAACEAAERARAGGDCVRVPVLVLQAGDDAVVHPSGIDTFFEGLAQGELGSMAHARKTIPEARHEMLVEIDAARQIALGSALRFFAAHAVNTTSATRERARPRS